MKLSDEQNWQASLHTDYMYMLIWDIMIKSQYVETNTPYGLITMRCWHASQKEGTICDTGEAQSKKYPEAGTITRRCPTKSVSQL